MSTEYKCVSCGKLVQYFRVAEFLGGSGFGNVVCVACVGEDKDAFERLRAPSPPLRHGFRDETPYIDKGEQGK